MVFWGRRKINNRNNTDTSVYSVKKASNVLLRKAFQTQTSEQVFLCSFKETTTNGPLSQRGGIQVFMGLLLTCTLVYIIRCFVCSDCITGAIKNLDENMVSLIWYLTACNSDTLQASQCRARGKNSRTCSGSRESYGKSRQKCECEK